MNRSVSELAKAAKDSGFEGDPLTEEIVAKMTELEKAASGASFWRAWTISAGALALAMGLAVVVVATQHRADIAIKDAQISELKSAQTVLQSEKDSNSKKANDQLASELKGAADQLRAGLSATSEQANVLKDAVFRLSQREEIPTVKPDERR